MSERDYDLTLRGPVGSSQRYACREELNILDFAGRPAIRQLRSAALKEEILDLASDGAPLARWKYADFKCEIESNDAKDAYGLIAPVQRFWEADPKDLLPPSGTIVVESAIEKGDAFYPNTDAFGLSKTVPSAFMTAELVLHTRQFSMLANRVNGGIDQLHRVGDSVKMPCSGRIDHARNGDMFDAAIHRDRGTLRFEAVTSRHGREAALLTYDAPYDVICPGWGPTHCEQVGLIWVDVATGWLVAGEHIQTNYMSGVHLMPDGSGVPINVRFETSIELVSD